MNNIDKIIRPKFLTWLCLGSGVAGLMWISMLLSVIIFSINGKVPSGLFPGLVLEYLQAGYLFIVVEIIMAALGITGVILMWQMKKIGFYLYSAAKTMIYFMPVIFIGFNHLTFPGLFFTSLLITLYGVIFTGFPIIKKKK